MRKRFRLLAAAQLFVLAFAWSPAGETMAAEWTRNEARDEIVRNYGAVRPIIGKDDSLSYAIDLGPDLEDPTLLAPFAPIVELILSTDNAAPALALLKGSESLRSLSLDIPTEDVLKSAAEFKNLRTLWMLAPEDEVLTSLDALLPAKGLQAIGFEGYTLTAGAAETLAQFAELTGLTLACDLRGNVLKPLAELKKLTSLDVDDPVGEPVDLQSLAELRGLQSLSLQLAADEPLDAKGFEAIASLPKLERLDLGSTPWKEDDVLKLKSSRSLKSIACDSSLAPEDAARLIKEFAPIRFIPYGPDLSLLEAMKSPKVTVMELEYDDSEEGDDLPPRDPAKKYIGDGLITDETPVESDETIARLRRILSNRDTYQDEDSVDCGGPERVLRLTEGDVTLEILFCAECRYIEVNEIRSTDGLIAKPGESSRYAYALNEAAGVELTTIVDHVLAK